MSRDLSLLSNDRIFVALNVAVCCAAYAFSILCFVKYICTMCNVRELKLKSHFTSFDLFFLKK